MNVRKSCTTPVTKGLLNQSQLFKEIFVRTTYGVVNQCWFEPEHLTSYLTNHLDNIKHMITGIKHIKKYC